MFDFEEHGGSGAYLQIGLSIRLRNDKDVETAARIKVAIDAIVEESRGGSSVLMEHGTATDLNRKNSDRCDACEDRILELTKLSRKVVIPLKN